MQKTHHELPTIIAHRGAPELAPENTLVGLKAAKALGATWVEFDVQLTKDLEPIVFHDIELNRTTSGKGLVSETPLADILRLDAGAWFNAKFKGERVPTLKAFLGLAASLGFGINVELKGNARTALDLVKATINALNSVWLSTLPLPFISSSSLDCLDAYRKCKGNFPFGWITDQWRDDVLSVLKSIGAASLHIEFHQLTPERIQIVKKAGYLLLAYTVNNTAIAKQLISQGVDALFSDNPRVLADS